MEATEVIERMIPSDRLIIVADNEELYRGYVANVCREKIKGYKIMKMGLSTHVFRKKETARYIHTQVLGEELLPENVNDIQFSDLEMIIYTKMIVERV